MRELRIKNKKESVGEIERFIEEICEERKLTDSLYGNILLSVLEVVEITFLSKVDNDTENDIYIHYNEEGEKIKFSIHDTSKAINYKQSFDELNEEFTSDRDKGMFLISSLSDEIHFIEEGSIIVLDFITENVLQKRSDKRENTLDKYYNQEKRVTSKK